VVQIVRHIVALLLALLMTAAVAVTVAQGRATIAKSRNTSCARAVGWQSARRMIGRIATIKGRVVGTKYASSSFGSPTFLDVGARYPNPRRFSVVIWTENRALFGRPENRYRGRSICVRGYVSSYGGTPQIEASSPAQIAMAR
jgi:hypothetical protein